ncbi:MAG: 5-methylthioadenosine/S-adenosylhomocysteine deaminase [Rubritepida sp.]|nr:5-methylthioadenosine/S-adenosylhomocysteine deaminase [Rubritepida sp.]
MILIHDTTVVTVDDADRIHYAAAIAIEGGRIAAIGPSAELLARYPDAERVDGRNRAVLPGFANTHTHFSLTLARGIFEDMSKSNLPPYRDLQPRLPLPKVSVEENRAMCRLGALEALRSGTTAVLEDGQAIAGYAQAMADTGLRLVLAERAWDKGSGTYGDPSGFIANPALAEASIARIERLHAEWHGAADGRVAVGIAAWSPDMCSPEMLRGLLDLQERADMLCTIHLNQLWGEVAAVESVRGMKPTEYLHANGFLNSRLVAAHCRCMVPEEEELLGRSGASVAFNSAIAARRGLSPRIGELEGLGCNISLGTDNMAEDMVEVMRTGLFMERVRRNDGREPTPEQALRWATRNGYAALGIPDGGWLASGNRADLIMIRTDRAHLVPLMRLVSSFVHQGQGRDVESVMVDGRWILLDGEVLTMDEAALVEEADRIGRAAWSRLFAAQPELQVPAGFSPIS